MRHRTFLQMTLALLTLPLFAAGGDNLSAKFTVSQPTMLPGATLQPGSYSIHLLDHLQDRFIVRIDRAGSTSHQTFIGVPAPNLKGASSTGSGPVLWDAAPDGKSALRGFTFGARTLAIEFVYPKDDAVALAKLNHRNVLAIDPASEGRPAQVSSLSRDEMEMVTLWMLSPTQVGPNDSSGPQIKATKLQVASAETAKPPLARLPQTASLLPTISLIGLFSAMGAAFMAGRRRRARGSV